LVSEDASASELASLLAIFIAEDGAVLTKTGNAKKSWRLIGVDVVPGQLLLAPPKFWRSSSLLLTRYKL